MKPLNMLELYGKVRLEIPKPKPNVFLSKKWREQLFARNNKYPFVDNGYLFLEVLEKYFMLCVMDIYYL